MPHLRRLSLILASCGVLCAAGKVEILRDEYGVPHIFAPTAEGRLLGHVHLGVRLVEEHGRALEPDLRAELVHAVASHHDGRAARTAEAAVLHHANALDAAAATRPVPDL